MDRGVDGMFEDVTEAVAGWMTWDDQVRAAAGALASLHGDDADAWRTLAEARERRSAIQDRVGAAVVRWIGAGGTLELLEPDTTGMAATGADAPAANATPRRHPPATPRAEPRPAVREPAAPTTTPRAGPVPSVAPVAPPSPPVPRVSADRSDRPEPTPIIPLAPRATRAELERLIRVGVGASAPVSEDRGLPGKGQDHVDRLLVLLSAPLTA